MHVCSVSVHVGAVPHRPEQYSCFHGRRKTHHAGSTLEVSKTAQTAADVVHETMSTSDIRHRTSSVFSIQPSECSAHGDETWNAAREAEYIRHKFDKRPEQRQRRRLIDAARRLASLSSEHLVHPDYLHQGDFNNNYDNIPMSFNLGPCALNENERQARMHYLEGVCLQQRQQISKVSKRNACNKGRLKRAVKAEPCPDAEVRRGSSATGSSRSVISASNSPPRTAPIAETSPRQHQRGTSSTQSPKGASANAIHTTAEKLSNSQPAATVAWPASDADKAGKGNQRCSAFGRAARPTTRSRVESSHPENGASHHENSIRRPRKPRLPKGAKVSHQTRPRHVGEPVPSRVPAKSAFLTTLPSTGADATRYTDSNGRMHLRNPQPPTSTRGQKDLYTMLAARDCPSLKQTAQPYLSTALSLVNDAPEALQCHYTAEKAGAKSRDDRDALEHVNYAEHKFLRINRFHDLSAKQDQQYTKVSNSSFIPVLIPCGDMCSTFKQAPQTPETLACEGTHTQSSYLWAC
jgi:hypothetical protein